MAREQQTRPAPALPGQRPRGAGPDDGPGPDLLDLDALEARARELLPADVVDYYAGGAEDEVTLREAPAAWRSWRLRPRVLRGTAAVSLATTLLGSEVATPVGVAPWAYQAMASPEGERGTAEGPAAAGALMTVSTSASTGLAEVAVAPSAPRWFQLYRVHSPAHTDDLARRARAVFVGRPAVWALAAGGAAGVARVLAGLTAELAHTMALCGLADVTAVPRDTVTEAARGRG